MSLFDDHPNVYTLGEGPNRAIQCAECGETLTTDDPSHAPTYVFPTDQGDTPSHKATMRALETMDEPEQTVCSVSCLNDWEVEHGE